jgi:diguanylate cyclase (GGDEF)-like protein
MLDVPTLLFMLVLTNGLLAGSLWIGIGPGARHGVGRWTSSLALEALTFALIVVRGPSPEVGAVVAVNVCAAVSLALQFDALLVFHGERLSRWWLVVAPLAVTPALGLLTRHEAQRTAAVGTLFGVTLVAIAACLHRLHSEGPSLGRRFVSLGYRVGAAALALRAVAVVVDPVSSVDLRGEGPVPALSALAAFVVTLMTSFGFLLMHRERTQAEIEQLAMLDPLTGIFNRRSFFDLADRVLSHAKRHDRPLSLVLLDVDHFKRINDTHGHPTGDAVLQHVVDIVQACLRKSDLLARYGGEEFCLLLPDAGPDAARSLAERIRLEIEAAKYRNGALTLTLTSSAGVASLAAADDTVAGLVRRADEALYLAKRQGRNRVVTSV